MCARLEFDSLLTADTSQTPLISLRQIFSHRFSQEIHVRFSGERHCQINLRFAHSNCCHSDRLGGNPDEILGEIHQKQIIHIRLVELEHGEFRIVIPVHPFVAKYLRQFIDAIVSPDNQPLQIEFISDPQIQLLIKGVVPRLEWSGRSAAV